ncbi:TetR/AcrR family transcriptional regulator [Rhodococcus aerolatus]
MAEDDGVELVVRLDAPAPVTPTRDARADIVRAATALFLRHGYPGTSTDQVAAAAAVSKQTVYNQFRDKEQLFRTVVLGVTATAEQFAAGVGATADEVGSEADLEPALLALARRYLATTLSPTVLALRRLVIGEASRFPDLAAEYHRRAPARVMGALAELVAGLQSRGLLAPGDPADTAEDLAFLLLGAPLDRGLFHVDTAAPSPAEVDARAARAVRVFLAAHWTT